MLEERDIDIIGKELVKCGSSVKRSVCERAFGVLHSLARDIRRRTDSVASSRVANVVDRRGHTE